MIYFPVSSQSELSGTHLALKEQCFCCVQAHCLREVIFHISDYQLAACGPNQAH